MSRREEMELKLNSALAPVVLQLVDESHQHNVPPGAESHWNLLIVSERFDGRTPVERQRAVFDALGDALRSGVHALTMKTLTPQEWQREPGQGPHTSPQCRGGEKKPD